MEISQTEEDVDNLIIKTTKSLVSSNTTGLNVISFVIPKGYVAWHAPQSIKSVKHTINEPTSSLEVYQTQGTEPVYHLKK